MLLSFKVLIDNCKDDNCQADCHQEKKACQQLPFPGEIQTIFFHVSNFILQNKAFQAPIA